MTEDDSTAADVIEQHTDAILRARARLSGYNDELNQRLEQPFEQNRIFSRHYGAAPAAPQTRVIHRVDCHDAGDASIGHQPLGYSGADLLYEVPGRKYVLIQYKQADPGGRVTLDAPQLNRLMGECPVQCLPFYRNNSWCGSWYCVMDGTNEVVMPACTAQTRFAKRKSAKANEFTSGLRHDAFDEMFAKCYAGAPITIADVSGQAFRAMSSNRVLFSVVEREPIPPTA